jgi:hypothetical protein
VQNFILQTKMKQVKWVFWALKSFPADFLIYFGSSAEAAEGVIIVSATRVVAVAVVALAVVEDTLEVVSSKTSSFALALR